MKTIIITLVLLTTLNSFGQMKIEIDPSVETKQENLVNHINEQSKKQVESMKYNEIIIQYKNLQNSYKGHNTLAGIGLITSPLILPAFILDVFLFMPFGAEGVLIEFWDNRSSNKWDIKRKKEEILNLYNNLK